MAGPTNCVQDRSNLSNTVLTVVNHAQITPADGGLVKQTDKAYADINDNITYTINLKNTGNTPANNIILYDTIPNGTILVPNSVKLNGLPQPGINPQGGVPVGSLQAGQTASVVFVVNVTTIPSPNPIPNTSLLQYSYTTDPSSPNGQTSKILSNTVYTQVNHGNIDPNNGGLVKFVDKAYAQVGDTLTYTIRVANSGTTTVNNVVLSDTIPNGTALVANSVSVNGVLQPGVSPQKGVNIGTIGSGSVATVVFQVLVNTIPSPNSIKNSGLVDYSYTVDPSIPIIKSIEAATNVVLTTINSAIIGSPNKTSLPYYVDLNDTITYTIKFNNSGNVTASNVVVSDTIPAGIQFIAGSVVVNGVTVPSADPTTGIGIGDVASGKSVSVVFKALVNTIPSPNPVPNTANVAYQFIVDPNTGGREVQTSSNTNTTFNNVRHGGFGPDNNGNSGLNKTVNTKFASVGDVLTYNLNLKNTGNIPVNNAIVTDTIPNGTKLVTGSVLVNGSPQPTADLAKGVNLGTIGAGNSANVSFKVVVTSIPDPNPIPNSFDVAYSYAVDPSTPKIINSRDNSNTVFTQVNDPQIADNFNKLVDKKFADIGDTVTYTLTLSNKGTVPGNNVTILDTIPAGTTLIPGSVTVNGVGLPSANPQNGILVGSVNPGQTVITTFAVKVDTIPSPNPIPNTSIISYTYTKDPSVPDGVSVNGNSNTVFTQVNHGDIPQGSTTKAASQTIAKRGDIVTYTFVIPNSGNIPVSNVVLVDNLQAETTFVPNTVTINGVNSPNQNPNPGINIGTIPAGTVTTVTFGVLVNSIPNNATYTVNNVGNVKYQYIVDPSNPAISKSTITNQTSFVVKDARINFVDGGYVKAVDKQYAQIGDTLTYTLRLNNTGNVDALNLVVTDTIPDGTTFIAGSVSVNGVSQPNLDMQTGVNIQTLKPNTPATITFKVTVNDTIPDTNQVLNQGLVSYEFINQQGQPPVKEKGVSNQVITNVSSVNFKGDNFVKTTTPKFVAIGDTITYGFKIKNAGNIAAENVIFKDTIPEGSKFIQGSLVLNGVTIPSADPQAGINLQQIAPGQTVNLVFNTVVTKVPKVNPMPDTGLLSYSSRVNPNLLPLQGASSSNTVYNQVNSTDISMVKTTDSDSYAVGDTITYTIRVTNNGNVDADNYMISDILSPQLEFVTGSLTIDDVAAPTGNIINGVDLGPIAPGQTIKVSFKAKILSRPTNGTITNQACSNYMYIVDPSMPQRQGNTCSNSNKIDIAVADLSLVKIANKEKVVLGEPITYTLTIVNIGTVNATNIIVKDTLQKGLEFIPNTFNINGTPINGLDITAGFNIGTLTPGQKVVITYQAKVVRVCCDCSVMNHATATFSYKTSILSPIKTKTVGPASVRVQTASPTFKQLDIDGMLVIPCPKAPIEEVNDIKVEIDVLESHVIETIEGISSENRKLTGSKLVISGILRQIVDYTANDTCQSNHSAYFERKFSTFIVLPKEFSNGTHVDISSYIEDIYYKQIDSRNIFTNITLLINANILC